MGNLPVLKPAEVVAIPQKLGFVEARQRGSHKQYRHVDGRCTTVPFHKGRDVPPIPLRRIAKDIGLTPDEFVSHTGDVLPNGVELWDRLKPRKQISYRTLNTMCAARSSQTLGVYHNLSQNLNGRCYLSMKSGQFTIRKLICGIVACGVFAFGPLCFAQSADLSRVVVHVVTDEAEAVLAILAKKKANQPVTEADWQLLFSSEGYIRLKKREAAMQRAFEDAEFKTFVLSDGLAERAQALAETLAKWKSADVSRAAKLALAYLPEAAHIQAKIYPEIKPKTNSFVFDVETDQEILLYLDPNVIKEKFENTLAHELHHIGYASGCPSKETSDEIAKLPPNAQEVLKWTAAFGEGFAMLAAAGSPDVHPHAVSSPEERARWGRDVANFNNDLKKVESFFIDILENRLTKVEVQKTASSFYGVQGAWYTVGWKMSVLIEKTYGRAKLIECICDQRKLRSTYNKAAAKYNRKSREQLALWSASVINGIKRSKL